MQQAAKAHSANIILMDLGPNLSAINRTALIAADYVIMPLFPDVFSLQGLHISGPALHKWHAEWNDRLAKNTTSDLSLPLGNMQPLGYIVLQYALRMDRPVRAYNRWLTHIPQDYQEYMLGKHTTKAISARDDPERLALLKHYYGLLPIAQEAHKPMFHLKPGDGAMGALMQATQGAYLDFEKLAREIARRVNIPLP